MSMATTIPMWIISTAKSNSSTLAKEWFFANCLLDNMFQIGLLSLTFEIYGIGISTVETTKVAALQKDYQSQTRTIEGSKRLV